MSDCIDSNVIKTDHSEDGLFGLITVGPIREKSIIKALQNALQ